MKEKSNILTFSYKFFSSGDSVASRVETTLAIYTKSKILVLFGVQLHIYEFILTKIIIQDDKVWKDITLHVHSGNEFRKASLSPL